MVSTHEITQHLAIDQFSSVIALCSSGLPLSFRKDCVLPFCPEMYTAAHA